MENSNRSKKASYDFFKEEWKSIFLVLFVSGMVLIDFIRSGIGFQFGTNTLIALSILVLLVLAKSFDKLAVGKWLVVEGNLRKVEKSKDRAEARNDELIKNFVAFSANLNLANTNKIDLNFPKDLLSKVGVTRADNEDVEREEQEEEAAADNTNDQETGDQGAMRRISPMSFRTRRGLSQIVIDNYAAEHHLLDSDIIREVRFTKAFQSLDPIMERSVLFDGYFQDGSKEVFFEVGYWTRTSSPMYADRLYISLTKLFLYSRAKNVDVKLILIQFIIGNEKDEIDERRGRFIGRRQEQFKTMFQPAIDSGFLEIKTVKLDDVDVENAEKRAAEVREKRIEI